ncbi:MAG TPA: hypothetical protein VHF51_20420, partial [Solirubrobacteraceae bacterium]|nr:hypothetical protein [Solirubrobacteraceae bacterium]
AAEPEPPAPRRRPAAMARASAFAPPPVLRDDPRAHGPRATGASRGTAVGVWLPRLVALAVLLAVVLIVASLLGLI